MRLAFVLGIVVAGPGWCWACGGQNADESAELTEFAEALAAFDADPRGAAPTRLQQFLDRYPKSQKAPEALYRLAVLELSFDSETKAQGRLERLIAEFPRSGWAQVAAFSQLQEKPLFDVANRIRKSALSSKNQRAAEGAGLAFDAGLKRFAKEGSERFHEVLYKLIDCDKLLGDEREAEGRLLKLDVLAGHAKADNWLKLARLRQTTKKNFDAGLDELLEMSGTDGEAPRLIITLAETIGPELEGERALKARFCRAQALVELERKDDGIAEYKELVSKHRASPWAAEALFWLAEEAHQRGNTSEAQRLLQELVRDFPEHRRAVKAEAWANWFENAEATAKKLEDSIVSTRQTLEAGNFAFSARLRGLTDEEVNWTIDLTLKRRNQFRLDYVYKNTGLLLVSNAQGAWIWDRVGAARKAREPLELPVPVGKITTDSEKKLNFQANFSSENNAGPFEIGSTVPKYVTTKLMHDFHVAPARKLPGEKPLQVFVLEKPYSTGEPEGVELTLTDDNRIVAMSWKVKDVTTGKDQIVIVDNLRFGQFVGEDQIASPVFDPDTKVVEVDSISVLDVVAYGMRFGSELLSTLPARQSAK